MPERLHREAGLRAGGHPAPKQAETRRRVEAAGRQVASAAARATTAAQVVRADGCLRFRARGGPSRPEAHAPNSAAGQMVEEDASGCGATTRLTQRTGGLPQTALGRAETAGENFRHRHQRDHEALGHPP